MLLLLLELLFRIIISVGISTGALFSFALSRLFDDNDSVVMVGCRGHCFPHLGQNCHALDSNDAWQWEQFLPWLAAEELRITLLSLRGPIRVSRDNSLVRRCDGEFIRLSMNVPFVSRSFLHIIKYW